MYSTPYAFRFETAHEDNRGLLMLGTLSLVSDTTRWQIFGPQSGTRYNLTFEKSYRATGSDLELTISFLISAATLSSADVRLLQPVCYLVEVSQETNRCSISVGLTRYVAIVMKN